MDSRDAINRAAILQALRDWTDAERLELIQNILGMTGVNATLELRAATFAHARSLLKTDRPPPTDEEVQMWLDTRCIERYGS